MGSRALAELIRTIHEERDIPYREMARRTDACPRPLSHSQIADYAAGRVRKTPDSPTIEALAVALDVPVERVRDAVLEQYLDYVPANVDRGVDALIPPGLSDGEVDELRRLIQAWLAARP